MLDRILLRVACAVLLLVGAVALLGQKLVPHDPLLQHLWNTGAPPSAEYWLGTDQFGRDIFSRLVAGAKLSLTIGLVSPLLAGIVGIALGTVAGYCGGRIDRAVVRLTDMMMSFDPLLLGVLIVALLGPGIVNLAIAVAAALVPQFVRLSRASTFTVRNEGYVEAAVAMGRRHPGTIVRHVLPNISGPLIVMTTLWAASAVRLEASLSFIGLGAQPPLPSWGNMVREGASNLFGSPLPALFAGLAITLTVLSLNIVGDALRDALDPDRVTGR